MGDDPAKVSCHLKVHPEQPRRGRRRTEAISTQQRQQQYDQTLCPAAGSGRSRRRSQPENRRLLSLQVLYRVPGRWESLHQWRPDGILRRLRHAATVLAQAVDRIGKWVDCILCLGSVFDGLFFVVRHERPGVGDADTHGASVWLEVSSAAVGYCHGVSCFPTLVVLMSANIVCPEQHCSSFRRMIAGRF